MIISFIFILECVFKIIAFGFAKCEGSYLKDEWNILDFNIVLFSILDISLPKNDLSFLKVLNIYDRL